MTTNTTDANADVQPLGTGALATLDMPKEHYNRFYEGFSNSVLWPAFHSRGDLIEAQDEDYTSYREVNAYVARAILKFVKPDSPIWIHDYHYLTVAKELRARGVTQPIGFFLHTPFPARSIMVSVPHHRELVRAMLAYDLIGFQTEDDLTNFSEYLSRELAIELDGDTCMSPFGTTRLAAFPIGIDVKAFSDQATKAAAQPEMARLRASLQGRKLAIGVDRLDYSKGLPNRFRAFDRLFGLQPARKQSISFLQIAVPSRVDVPAYQDLNREIAGLVGEINGRHAEIDWTPIRYLNSSFPQQSLAGFYRMAAIGLVTPFQDGMNLVAKEYVAAQNPLDPGMLVLSEFAGAAKQLDTAVLVNPHDIEGMARGIIRALDMSTEERRERWTAMLERLEDSALDAWFADFVTALEDVPPRLPKVPGRIQIPSPSVSLIELDIASSH